jgi:hypothetical protein
VGGLGLAGVAAGAATGILTIQKWNKVEGLRDKGQELSSEAKDARAAGRTFSLISSITLPVGAAAVVAGVVLIATSSSKKPSTSAVLAPTPLPGGAGVTMLGRF